MGVAGFVFSAATSADDKSNDIPGPIDSIQDLQDTAKMLFKMADTNNDNQISQKEAIDVGNLLIGGFFFRADTNGDGTLTPEEARQAREALFRQQPLMQYILQRVRPSNPPVQASSLNQPGQVQPNNQPAQVARNLAANPIQTIGNLLDTNNDRKLEASELRQAVQNGVQTLFMVADRNNDGQLSPAELNAAVGEVAKSAVQMAFQVADTDRNGTLSMAEFDQALTEPAHAFFRVIDANGDNQISLEEVQQAEQILVDQINRLRVPEPSNSISNQYRRAGGIPSGTFRTPVQVAPNPAAVAPAPVPSQP
jgi:Ca2+-binding EF-hand superfamily protein